ncbi:MAG: hypothetical protein V4805_11240 [Pseudomonadota bacterium]
MSNGDNRDGMTIFTESIAAGGQAALAHFAQHEGQSTVLSNTFKTTEEIL